MKNEPKNKKLKNKMIDILIGFLESDSEDKVEEAIKFIKVNRPYLNGEYD